MIVPRSSQLVSQDNDYGLFTVTLFKKVAEEFKHHAREKKYDMFLYYVVLSVFLKNIDFDPKYLISQNE